MSARNNDGARSWASAAQAQTEAAQAAGAYTWKGLSSQVTLAEGSDGNTFVPEGAPEEWPVDSHRRQ